MKKLALILLLTIGIGVIFYFKFVIQPGVATPGVSSRQEDASSLERVDAIDFSFQDLDGNKYKLSDFKGKVIILNIRFRKCGACAIEADLLEEFYSQIAANDAVELVAVFEGEPAEVISKYIETIDVKFPVYLDPIGISAYKYRVNVYPSSFIIDKKFKISAGVKGVLDWSSSDVADYLERLVNE
ncbi:MAG: TlpA disulfide reductase family protein [Candidatus Saelkia tenebricola]|nr:TlpA disulfide reductase family protein [Candidatus Saelkia tenebricola]